MTPTPTVVPGGWSVIAAQTPFGALGWALALAIFVVILVIGIAATAVILRAVWTENDSSSRRLARMMQSTATIGCSKFTRIRPTAIVFGVLLTTITLVLLKVVDLASAKEAFWLALGVILGSFSNAITKLTEGSDNDSNRES